MRNAPTDVAPLDAQPGTGFVADAVVVVEAVRQARLAVDVGSVGFTHSEGSWRVALENGSATSAVSELVADALAAGSNADNPVPATTATTSTADRRPRTASATRTNARIPGLHPRNPIAFRQMRHPPGTHLPCDK